MRRDHALCLRAAYRARVLVATDERQARACEALCARGWLVPVPSRGSLFALTDAGERAHLSHTFALLAN